VTADEPLVLGGVPAARVEVRSATAFVYF
jgi:hypothetical protein